MLSKSITKAVALARHFRNEKNLQPPKDKGSLATRVQNKGASAGALYLYDIIGRDWWTGEGVTAAEFVAALDTLKGVKQLDVYINSPGGDVMEAKAMYANLMRFDAQKTVHVDGIAASAATFVAMAGDKIVTAPEGTWMIHETWGGQMGNADDLRAYADLLDMQNADLASIYSKRTGLAEAQVRDLMAAETWMNASKALELKFSDEIEEYDDEDADEDSEAQAAAKQSQMVRAVLESERVLHAHQAAIQEYRVKLAKNKVAPIGAPQERPGKPGDSRSSGKPAGR